MVMITKTLGTLIIVLICILVLPIGIAVVGGVFGIVIGVIGAVFGAIFSVIGTVFGSVFGAIGWFFDSLFGWDFDVRHFFGCDIYTVGMIAVVVALILRSSRTGNTNNRTS
jgi:hypothetical protein